MQSLHGNCLIAYARHKYILTMVNGEYRYFNGGDTVCGCKPNSVDKCVENFVFVSRDTLSLFLPMLKEEALNLHAHKKFLHYSFITVVEIFLFSGSCATIAE